VAVHDQDVAQCFRVRQHNVHNEADATAFTRTVDLFAGTTGAGGLRSEHMRHAKPDAVKMSFSSANTEEGTLELSPDSWLNDGHSVKIQLGGQSTASRSRRVSAAGQEVWERGFRDSLSKSFGSGMGVEIGFSTSVRSSFVGNLAGRCRETELEAEELILMNVIRSMAEVSVLDAGEARQMSDAGERLIFEHFERAHPDLAAKARHETIPRGHSKHPRPRTPPRCWPRV
ncbi:MAG: hypothetical protein AAFQ82_21405, partial [Myxococcota bacterium]